MNEVPSLKKLYGHVLLSKILGGLSQLILILIVPRALSPTHFGSFQFLTVTFEKLFGLLNVGTLVGFYTKLSKRPEEKKLITFYSLFILSIICIAILFVTLSIQTGLSNWIFPDQETQFIWLALGFGITTLLFQLMTQIMDTYGLTILFY